jgi:hypothetical protein
MAKSDHVRTVIPIQTKATGILQSQLEQSNATLLEPIPLSKDIL